jgi:hypothetical protein
MKFFNFLNLSSILILLLAISCETEREVTELPYDNKLVINSLIDNESPMEFSFGKSRSIFKNQESFELQTHVLYLEEDGKQVLLSYDSLRRRYFTSLLPQEGKEYFIQLQSPGFQTASAKTKMPFKPAEFNIRLDEDVFLSPDSVWFDELSFEFLDNRLEENFYMVRISYFSQRLSVFYPFKPENALEENVGLEDTDAGYYLFTDKGKNGEKIRFKFTLPFNQSNPDFNNPNDKPLRFLIELSSITKGYYNYYRTLDKNQDVPPLLGEPIQLYSNIANGLGIFAGKTTVRDTIKS